MAENRDTFTTRVRKRLQFLETFFTRDLWVDQPKEKGRRRLYHLARMGVLLWEGVKRNDVFLLSAALTYKVTFALIPLLAKYSRIASGEHARRGGCRRRRRVGGGAFRRGRRDIG